MPLSIFRFLADHPPFLAIAVVVFVLTARQIMQEAALCTTLANNEPVPDHMFGYSANQLNHLYKVWGRDGRDAYVRLANVDLFPYMESYTIVLGTWLVVASKRFRMKDDRIAYLALVTMALDVCETLVQRRGSKVYPEQLSGLTIAMGSICSQAKWALLSGSLVLVAMSFVFGHKSVERRGSRTRHAAPSPTTKATKEVLLEKLF